MTDIATMTIDVLRRLRAATTTGWSRSSPPPPVLPPDAPRPGRWLLHS